MSLFPGFASLRATEPRAYAPATRPAPTRARTSASRSEGSEGSEEDRPSHATTATRAASSAAASHWSSGAPRARADPDPKAETAGGVLRNHRARLGSRRETVPAQRAGNPRARALPSARAPGWPARRGRASANRTAAALASASPGGVVSASLSASSSPDAKPTSARHSSARTSAAAKGGDANRRVTELETRGPRLSV